MPKQSVEQRFRRRDIEGPKPYSAHIEPRQPSRRILRPPCQQHQQRVARRERHQSLDRGLALSVDPVKVLQQQYRRPRRDHLFDRMAHGIDNGPPPQQRFKVVPAGIVDGLVENGAKRGGPKIGVHGRHAFRQFRLACGRDAAHLQSALKQFLQQARNGTACSSGLPSASRTCQSFARNAPTNS